MGHTNLGYRLNCTCKENTLYFTMSVSVVVKILTGAVKAVSREARETAAVIATISV